MMNKLAIDVLPVIGGWINKLKRKILKYNLNYIIMPLLYLIIMTFMVNAEVIDTKVIDKLTVKKMDSYNEIVITNDIKKKEILKKYNLTDYEFNVVCAITLAEAEYNSYDDAYAVINTIYNRTKSNRWVKSVDNKFGAGKGTSLYYQAISPKQFTVYASGSYKKYMGVTDLVGYNAIIDFLYTEDILHNYLSFRSNYVKVAGSETFSAKGNNYFNEV